MSKLTVTYKIKPKKRKPEKKPDTPRPPPEKPSTESEAVIKHRAKLVKELDKRLEGGMREQASLDDELESPRDHKDT